jgi:electron transport complex protein RnfB
MWLTPLLLICALFAFALAHAVLRKKYPQDNQALIEVIDQMLPQTQCAQCSYPGCRPYAEAIVSGEALNLCPPGGQEMYLALLDLMGDERRETPPTYLPVSVAVIDETQCIGCTLCLPPCPVDAIVGAANKMHTIIEEECTGCELCIPACPVDCIELRPVPVAQPVRFIQPARPSRTQPPRPAPRACINCGHCNPVCPVDLPVQELLHTVQHSNLALASTQGLSECIECGLCDRACPSHIAMASLFGESKHQLLEIQAQADKQQSYRDRFSAHTARQVQQLDDAADKRAQRLQKANRFS